MLRNASDIHGYDISASDGTLGTVSDFLFDDVTWRIRWLVVETGGWLLGRKVLLPPSALGHLDAEQREFSVKLTRQQVQDSPDIDTDRPVSRQLESGVYDYYGWYPYWSTGLYVGGYGALVGAGVSPALAARAHEEEKIEKHLDDEDPHLCSVAAMTGYHIHASDGAIGHVETILLEEADWSIHYLVVDTKNWLPGKSVLIAPRSVRKIDWAERQVTLDVDRQRVKDSPAYDAAVTVDRAYEALFHNYYGGVRPDARQ